MATPEQLERSRAMVRAWQDLNREKIKADARSKYAANPELFKAKSSKWRAHYKTNGCQVSKTEKRCCACKLNKPIDQFPKCVSNSDGKGSSCKPCNNARKTKWRRDNPERFKKWANANRQERFFNDPQYRFAMTIRSRVGISLRHNKKCGKTEALIGCTIPELRHYLELQWEPWMNWSNYGRGDGKWCIDHKQPISIFDMSDPEQQKLCWHYTNLQPLCWRKNLMKSDRLDWTP